MDFEESLAYQAEMESSLENMAELRYRDNLANLEAMISSYLDAYTTWEQSVGNTYMKQRKAPKALPSYASNETVLRIVDWVGELFALVAMDRDSVLSLRLVSKTFKVFCDLCKDDLFRKISYTFPPSNSDGTDLQSSTFRIFDKLKSQVRHLQLAIRPTHSWIPALSRHVLSHLLDLPRLRTLTITLLPSVEKYTDQSLADEGLFEEVRTLWSWSEQNLLDTDCCDTVGHYWSLVIVRRELQAAHQRLENLNALNFSNLSIMAIQALRYGAFGGSSFLHGYGEEKFPRKFWSKITVLRINMVPWCDFDCQNTGQVSYLEPSYESTRYRARRDAFSVASKGAHPPWNLGKHSHASTVRRADKDAFRQGALQLHAWLRAFSKDITMLTWNWVKPQAIQVYSPQQPRALQPKSFIQFESCNGINPLALDQVDGDWFSPTGICWNKLKELRMAGVRTVQADVELLLARMPNLKTWQTPMEYVGDGIEVADVFFDEDDRLWSSIETNVVQ